MCAQMTMKHLIRIILLLSLIFSGTCLSASNPERRAKRLAWRTDNTSQYSVSFGISGYPLLLSSLYTDGRFGFMQDYMIEWDRKMVGTMYDDYSGASRTTGTFVSTFTWNYSRWCSLSANLGLCPMWSTTISAMTDKVIKNKFGMAIVIMPEARVMYCNRPMVRVYSSLAMGAVFLPGFKECDYNTRFAMQFNLAGLEVGRKFYGMMQLGAGTMFSGICAGIGYKF